MTNYVNKSIPANYFRGMEAVGGKIYFDETGLTFKSHSINIQTGDERIDYKDIVDIKKRNTLGIVPNGISIITKDAKNHKFVVYKRKKVIEFLNNMRNLIRRYFMLENKIMESINGLITSNATPGVNYAVLTNDEKIVGSLGLKSKYDIQNEEVIINEKLNNIDTLYDIASLTKVVSTVTIIFRLIEKNMLNMDDKVVNFLPQFKYDDITIYDLLTHTSGLPADYLSKDIITYDEVLNKLFLTEKETEKGIFLYSDLDYMLLGLIIEKVCNKKLDIVFEEEVAIPLEMKSTGFNPKNKDMVAPTEITKDRGLVCGVVHDEKAFSMNGVAGHAGLFSNINDLTNFCKMILNDGIYNGKKYLDKKVIDSWFYPVVDNNQFKRSFSWFVADNPNIIEGENCISFSGFTGPSISIDREKNIAIILLANRIHPTRDNSLIKYLRSKISSDIYKYLEKDFKIIK